MMDAVHEQYAEPEEEDAEPAFIVSIPGFEVALDGLKGAPAKILGWLQANPSWTARACISETFHQPLLYAADSKATGARKGDVKTPERFKIHTTVQAVSVVKRTKVAELMGTWLTVEGKTTFTDAIIWDMYSDQRLAEKAVRPFEDWLRMFAPQDAAKPTKKKIKQADKTLDTILDEGEWIG